MSGAEHPQRARELLDALDAYRPARQAFLATLGLPASNRDPRCYCSTGTGSSPTNGAGKSLRATPNQARTLAPQHYENSRRKPASAAAPLAHSSGSRPATALPTRSSSYSEPQIP